MRSRAPEYSGGAELAPARDPKTLAAVAGQPVPSSSASGSAAPTPASAAPVAVPRLPGTPELTKDGLYVFTSGGIELAVDPKHGGNAVRFALDGKDALVIPDPEYGAPSHLSVIASTATVRHARTTPFWRDPDPYLAELEGGTLLLKAEGDTGALHYAKRYRLDTARRSVEVTYMLENAADQIFAIYAVESHLVPVAGGLTFFPSAKQQPPSPPGLSLKINVATSVAWFAHDQSLQPAWQTADALGTESWVATANDNLLFVKTFGSASSASSPASNDEIRISRFYDDKTKQHPVVSIDESNSFREVRPGAAVVWNVRWFLRKLPPSIVAKPGNQELVGFVRGVIQ